MIGRALRGLVSCASHVSRWGPEGAGREPLPLPRARIPPGAKEIGIIGWVLIKDLELNPLSVTHPKPLSKQFPLIFPSGGAPTQCAERVKAAATLPDSWVQKRTNKNPSP